MKGQKEFSRAIADKIIALIKLKLKADTIEQKMIRNKIRKLGFYASNFGLRGGYKEQDFLNSITIVGENPILHNCEHPKIKVSGSDQANKNKNRDEYYVIDLCDRVLQLEGKRQHRFNFLLGDANKRGVKSKLPVDAYYPILNLAIEFKEKQHTESVKLFDKRETVSGITRDQQRRLYDQRRRDILPLHNIHLIEFDYSEFLHNSNKRLMRNYDLDLSVVTKKLSGFLKPT